MDMTTGGVLGGAIVLTQIVDRIVDSQFGDIAGKWKLTIVTFVSMVSALLGQMATGQEWQVAIMSSAVLTAFQVFTNQIYKQFFDKDEPAAEAK